MTKWIEDITASGILDKSLFDANTILKADTDNTPEALTVAEQRLVGRITSGEIAALTGAQAIGILSGANLDVGAFDVRGQTVTADALTSGRVIFAGASGVLSDDSDFNFATDTLTVTKLTTGDVTSLCGAKAVFNSWGAVFGDAYYLYMQSDYSSYVAGLSSGYLDLGANTGIQMRVGASGVVFLFTATGSSTSYPVTFNGGAIMGSSGYLTLNVTDVASTTEGDIWYSATENTIKVCTDPAPSVDSVVLRTATQTLTNKTFDATTLIGTTTIDTALTGIIRADSGVLSVDSTALLIANLENPPTEDLATSAPTSEWAFDFKAAYDAHTHALAAGATDVTATYGELNLLDLAGLTAGDLLVATGAATAAWQTPAGAGGLYGINVEVLADNKTLTAGTDKIYQYLDSDGANRIITLDTDSATAGDRFVIRSTAGYQDNDYLQIKQAAIELDRIYPGDVKQFIFDGTNWDTLGIGSGENDNKKMNLGIGQSAISYDRGLAIGYQTAGYDDGAAIGYGAYGYTKGAGFGFSADGFTYGAAFGYNAAGYSYGVAVGASASGYNYGVAIGASAQGHEFGVAIGNNAKTNSNRYSIALGNYSETERVGETSINIDAQTDQENNVVQGRWALETADATPVEMFCAGYGTSRFTIRASSALAFTMKIVARDNVAGHVAMYTFEGLIKRDAANNTAMSVINKAIIHEDDTDWDVAVTADDTNEALIITVTGDGANATQWAAVMDGAETHF